MAQDVYSASRSFVREMRLMTAGRDLVSIHRAVLQMQDWLEKNPLDIVVGTALEEFDILEEAAQIMEQKNTRVEQRAKGGLNQKLVGVEGAEPIRQII